MRLTLAKSLAANNDKIKEKPRDPFHNTLSILFETEREKELFNLNTAVCHLVFLYCDFIIWNATVIRKMLHFFDCNVFGYFLMKLAPGQILLTSHNFQKREMQKLENTISLSLCITNNINIYETNCFNVSPLFTCSNLIVRFSILYTHTHLLGAQDKSLADN